MDNFNREEQLRQLHEKRKQTTKIKVEKAIKRLTKISKSINFNSVAEEVGVSKATLYNHPELKERIKFLRNQQETAFVDSRIKRDESNQNAIIASLKRKIEKLERRKKNSKGKISDYVKEKMKNLQITFRSYKTRIY